MQSNSDTLFEIRENVLSSIKNKTKNKPKFFKKEDGIIWRSFVTDSDSTVTRITSTGIHADDEFYAYAGMCLEELVQVEEILE